MTQRITLKDIAEQSGYSVNTVSRALRGDERLPSATRKSIEDIAEKLGYIRNHAASSLRLGKTHTVAVILEDLRNMNYMVLLADIDAYLRQKGYAVMIMNSDSDQHTERQLLEQAAARNVDGVIFFPIDRSENAQFVRALSEHIPVVIMYRPLENVETDSVSVDDFQGGMDAGIWLMNNGRKKLLYAAGPESNSSHGERYKGLLAAMARKNIGVDKLRIISHADMMRSIAEGTTDGLLCPVDYDGIVAFDDDFAYHILYSLTEMGYHIDDDYSIVGFDHVRRGMSYLPRLASLAPLQRESLSQHAVDLLIQRINHPEKQIEHIVLPMCIHDMG